MEEDKKYSLVGVDGNAFGVMGYVKKAMRQEGFCKAEIDSYFADAMSGDYNHLLAVSLDWIDKCNEKALQPKMLKEV